MVLISKTDDCFATAQSLSIKKFLKNLKKSILSGTPTSLKFPNIRILILFSIKEKMVVTGWACLLNHPVYYNIYLIYTNVWYLYYYVHSCSINLCMYKYKRMYIIYVPR